MIDGLIEEVSAVRDRIRAHRDAFDQNETATRVSLIDPLLKSLGWDVADPCRVAVEHTVWGKKKSDYVLIGFNGEPVAGIEAKPLGASLDEYFLDMVEYSTLLEAPYYVITDGNIWQLYRKYRREEFTVLSAPGNTAKKEQIVKAHHVFDASITGKSLRKFALSLASLWRPDFALLPPIPAQGVIFWPETNFPAPAGWIRLPNLDLEMHRPARIRFPDGTEYPVTFWNEIMKHTVDWLATNDLLNQGHLPVPSHRKSLHIVDAKARHPNGKRFSKPEPVPKLSARWQKSAAKDHIKSDALTLLEHCGQDSSNVLVAWDEN